MQNTVQTCKNRQVGFLKIVYGFDNFRQGKSLQLPKPSFSA